METMTITNEELVERIQAGDAEAANLLIKQNEGLVESIIYNITRNKSINFADKEDLKQEGALALWESAKTYDCEREVKFATYATTNIKFAILQYLRINKCLNGVTYTILRKCRQYEEYIDSYQAKYNAFPTDEQIMRDTGLSKKSLIDVRDAKNIFNVESIEAERIIDGKVCTLKDDIPDKNNPYEYLFEDATELKEAFMSVNERAREILRYLFVEELKPKQIAEIMGISPQYVRNIHNKTLAKLRSNSNIIRIGNEEGYKVSQL